MATKNYIAAPIISSRNKSLVTFHESVEQGFLRYNHYNKPQSTLLPVRKPTLISPNNSLDDLRQHNKVEEEQQQTQEEQSRDPSPRPLKKRKIVVTPAIAAIPAGPATAAATASIAVAQAVEQQNREESAILKRKALAAKLRANGVSRKLVLKPADFARSVFCKNMNAAKVPIEMPFFPNPTETDQEIHAKHSQVLYNFVRKGDLEGFKKCVLELQETYDREQPFRCSNRFGESLMHLVCRRGCTEMVRFLVEQLSGASPSQMLAIQDDCHKTPLHDACWTPSPNFELVELILKYAPEQVLLKDIRGNTPFDYVRKDDYALWLRFLWERKSLLGSGGRLGRATN